MYIEKNGSITIAACFRLYSKANHSIKTWFFRARIMLFITALLILSLGQTNARQATDILPSLSSTVANWTSCLESLEDRTDRLIERFNSFRNAINVSEIAHVIYPGNRLGMSYNDAQQFCLFRGQSLCSYDEIFPNGDNVPTITGVITGNHWTPLRDLYNDWSSVGDGNTGLRHMATFGIPDWGLGFFETHFGEIKGNIFCCNPVF